MSGYDGSHLSLIDNRHAEGCDGAERFEVDVASYADGFAVIYTEWCSLCGAVDWDVVDYVTPEPEEIHG